MSALVFESVCKTYKPRKQAEIEALKDFTLEVPEGEIFGVAGPNGAGKSTAIKILMGLIKPDSGEVTVLGLSAGTKSAKNQIGFLPEVTLYHEFMSATELLSVHADLAGVDRGSHSTRCEEALERVGLSDRKSSRIKDFSKGMKQRFGIAQAIVGRPRILVLDELTSGLDPKAQASLLSLLMELRAQGLTIFFSSHHLQEIEKICDSVAVLHRGVLRAAGSMDSVLGSGEAVTLKVTALPGKVPPEGPVLWEKDSDGTFATTIEKSEILKVLKEGESFVEGVHTVKTQRQTLEQVFHQLTTDGPDGGNSQ